MAYPIWPTDLPQRSQVQGFQSAARGNRLVTAMDTGPGKARRRGAATRLVSCSIITDFNGRARFDRFYEEEVGFGVSTFLFPDQQSDGIKISTADGVPLLDNLGARIKIASWWRCKFGGTLPAISAYGGLILNIQFELIVLP